MKLQLNKTELVRPGALFYPVSMESSYGVESVALLCSNCKPSQLEHMKFCANGTVGIEDNVQEEVALLLVLRIVSCESLVNSEKIQLPHLHIKLGLRKSFVKAMNKDNGGFSYLKK
ncbi:hypothetical protein Trydic_g17005 [Trypoxylus dichotomus]